jgi:SAM-dependent methyltransferase
VDTRFLDALEYPNLEVLRHDITIETLPERAFDLVYARAVLTHLAGRDVALRRMAAALKPGGKLLVEEVDVVCCVPDPRFQGAALYGEGWAAALPMPMELLDHLEAALGARLLEVRRNEGVVRPRADPAGTLRRAVEQPAPTVTPAGRRRT